MDHRVLVKVKALNNTYFCMECNRQFPDLTLGPDKPGIADHIREQHPEATHIALNALIQIDY